MKRMLHIVPKTQHLSHNDDFYDMIIKRMMMMMKRMLPTAHEDKIFRAVSSPLLLDKFSSVDDDRTEGRADLTRSLLPLLYHLLNILAFFGIG